MHIRLYLNYELLDLAFNSTVSLKCDGGGVLSCLLVLKGLFTDFTWGGGSMEPSSVIRFTYSVSHFYDLCGRYCRFNGVTDRSKMVYQKQ